MQLILVSLRRALPLLLACSCGARTSLPTPAEGCPLGSSTVTRLGGPWRDPFTGLSLDGDGNAVLAHGVYLADGLEATKRHDVTMVHTLDPDGCIHTISIQDAFKGFTAGTAGTWFAVDSSDRLVELSPAGERLAGWQLLVGTGLGYVSVQRWPPVALPAGRAMMCAGVQGDAASFLGTPLTDLGAIHVAIFSPDGAAPVGRVFPVTATDGDDDGWFVESKAAWLPDGRVVAVAAVDGTLDVGGDEVVAEGGAMLWLELDEDLQVLSARVLGDMFGLPLAVRAGPDGSVYVGGGDEAGGVVARLGPGGETIWRVSMGASWPTALAVEPSGEVQYLALEIDDDPAPAATPPERSHQAWGRISAGGEPGPARTIVRYEDGVLPIALEIDGSGRPVLAGELHEGDHLELEGAGHATETEDGVFLARFDGYPTD